MGSSTKTDNKKKDILILRKCPTQGLEHTLSVKKMYSINFTKNNKKLCLSLHYNGSNSCLFVNDKKVHKFKSKDSKIVENPISLGHLSKTWSVDNMKELD